MPRLPNSDEAILELRKLEDYCLDPAHPRGRHKARVFRQALGLERRDAQWLREALRAAARDVDATALTSDAMGHALAGGHPGHATWPVRCGKNHLDHANRRRLSAVRDVLGAMMATREKTKNGHPSVLDVVALLGDRATDGLARGQVGTVVESLGDDAVLVEFSDDEGRAYAVVPCALPELLVLHYVPQAA
jgi:hypothetical protein